MNNTSPESTKKFVDKMWQLMMARGIVLCIVGLVLLIFPAATLTTLIFIMGIYWLIDGIVNTYNAFQSKKQYKGWSLSLFNGVIELIAGIVVLAKPFSSAVLTTSFLIWFLGIVAVINGVTNLLTGFRLKKQQSNVGTMIWAGIFSLILGLILMSSPFTSALVIIKIIGSFTLFAGIITLAVTYRIKKRAESNIV